MKLYAFSLFSRCWCKILWYLCSRFLLDTWYICRCYNLLYFKIWVWSGMSQVIPSHICGYVCTRYIITWYNCFLSNVDGLSWFGLSKLPRKRYAQMMSKGFNVRGGGTFGLPGSLTSGDCRGSFRFIICHPFKIVLWIRIKVSFATMERIYLFFLSIVCIIQYTYRTKPIFGNRERNTLTKWPD